MALELVAKACLEVVLDKMEYLLCLELPLLAEFVVPVEPELERFADPRQP